MGVAQIGSDLTLDMGCRNRYCMDLGSKDGEKIGQYTISLSHVHSEYHLYCPCPVRITGLLPMYGQLVHHLYCSCPVSTPSVLLMYCQNILYPAKILSVHNLCCPYSVTIYLYCSYPVRIPLLLPMTSYHTLSTGNVESEYHITCLFPVSTSSLLPMSC